MRKGKTQYMHSQNKTSALLMVVFILWSNSLILSILKYREMSYIHHRVIKIGKV